MGVIGLRDQGEIRKESGASKTNWPPWCKQRTLQAGELGADVCESEMESSFVERACDDVGERALCRRPVVPAAWRL